jgi:hypothetical protein
MDLSVIGIIGIILLIGIVKKNGIMLVDFAISAERDAHLRRSSDPRSLPAALPADPDDDAAAMLRACRSRSDTAPARSCANRWATRWSAGLRSARC